MTIATLIVFLIVMNLSIGTFGAHYGYLVNGAIIEPVEVTASWESAISAGGYLVRLATFQIQDVPAIMSLLFLLLNLIGVTAIVLLIRGTH